ncbi:ATP-dependent DNA helicase RecG, partial [Pseudomonadota bacterium]
IIENAERLGLAQLHQLRGRVGRGKQQSCCVLLYHAPLSALSQARLATLRETQDGFEIARRDLEQRGPGEVLGTRQTGAQQLHIADLVRDGKLLPEVSKVAEQLARDFPETIQPLIRRWVKSSQNYAHV